MIRFSLSCDNDHTFDGWFRNSEDFTAQKTRGLVVCPTCNSEQVDKTLMAPAVSTGRRQEKMALAMGEEQRKALVQLKAMAEEARKNADYVGDRFADEARKIHFGEIEPRGIYGEATLEEAKGLVEDEIDFIALPTFPDDTN